MIRSAFGLSLLFGMGMMMIGCGDDGDSSGGECDAGQVLCDGVCIDAIEPTLASIQTDVFNVSCAASACHDASLPQSGLDLSSLSASEAGLIDVASVQVPSLDRVEPGDSSASYLMNKLLGVDIQPPFLQMPIGGMLCDAKIDVIEQWIDDGAPIQ